MPNPFFYPNPVPPSGLLGRREEIQRIVNRIMTDGQSTAIIGEPRSGKTSLLEYLAAPETRTDLFGANSSSLLFAMIDCQTLGGQCTPAQFWETALHPVYEVAVLHIPDAELAAAYENCRKNGFGTQYLESLLLQIRASHWRLVLLLDEFDALLNHPVLYSVDLFGGLRSLASRGKGALVLVIASRSSLSALNEATRALGRGGSPYFNFLAVVSLGPWPTSAVGQLLDRAGDRFTPSDRIFITAVAGGQPYLLQVAAYETWQAYEEGEIDANRREQTVRKRIYAEVMPTLDDIWRLWSPMTKMAFAAVGLPQITSMRREFRARYLQSELQYFGPELKQLKDWGWILEDASVGAAWGVHPQAFLWWLADEIVKNVRDESTFEQWLTNQKLEGVITRGQKEQLGKAARAMGNVFKDGAKAFIEGASKGLGEGLGKPVP